MSWLEMTVRTAAREIEDVAAALTAEGFDDLVLEDQAEFERFLEDNRACWDYIDETLQAQLQGLSQIKLYLEQSDTDGRRRLEALVQRLDLELTAAELPETDWSESWKENYPPQPVGQQLIVLPYWLEAQSGDRLPVILDPGLTFGTGAHPSTQMVMELMEQLPLSGAQCLDLGSGSGILSIAALRLGAAGCIGVDIDPKAEDIARQNAAYNGYGPDVFTALTGNVLGDRRLMDRLASGSYELVVVNIVADVIIALAPVLPRFLGPQSVLVCSGILDVRLGEVTAALEQAGLTVTQSISKEDWRCVSAKRSIV